MSIHIPTASQTIGPFFHNGMLRDDARRQVLVVPETVGVRIRIDGYVYDGDGLGVPDAMIEIWQANHHGRYHHPADHRAAPLDPTFTGFGRCGTDTSGRYWFETIKPGRVPFDDRRLQAPHICVAVFARGLLNHLMTRLYFADEPANAEDPVLRCVPAERQATLLAPPDNADGSVVYHFDIVLQGAGETVFFNL
jgi:protocatechuate 3,4-dioxygenase alpha subunit